jgi:CubicO group peptidase (beta-lactamase class C family)
VRTNGQVPLQELIVAWHARSEAVGAAIGVVDSGHLVWATGVGHADRERRTPYDPVWTIQNIGSVSKLVTAATVMRLVEDGRIDLDKEADRHLDFRVRHPRYPRDPITVRRLLTHTSAIADSPAYRRSYGLADPNPDIGFWLRNYLDPGGELYDPNANWHAHPPGRAWAYSNVAFGLLALIAQSASATPFRECSGALVLAPAGMQSTGWFVGDVDRDRLATPYANDEDLVGIDAPLIKRRAVLGTSWHALHHYGFPTFPDGGLRTTLTDLARFASAVLASAGTQDGGLFLPPTMRAVFTDIAVVPEGHDRDQVARGQGLAWRHLESRSRSAVWGHRGRDPGIRSQLILDFEAGLGVVAMTNSSTPLPSNVDELLDGAHLQVRAA